MKAKIGLLLLGSALAIPAFAANILITEFDNGPAGYADIQNALTADGHTVTRVDARTGGAVATALSSGTYDQVYLYDLTAALYLNGADLTALASFWGNHKGLVIDTRSYGYYFQGSNASEINLIQNVATNLALSGGGVWVGTDHDPDWTRNGNPFLTAIGVNTIKGIYSDPVNYADPSSVLLSGVTPTDLWGGGASIGSAPLGLQPNGITMYLHFGHVSPNGDILPYISASFPLSGPPPIDPVPEPTTMALVGAGIVAAAIWRRRQ